MTGKVITILGAVLFAVVLATPGDQPLPAMLAGGMIGFGIVEWRAR